MVHNIETKLNYSLMNLTGHIYICNAQKLPILSRKSMATLGCLFSDLYASSQLSKSGLLWPLSEIRPATCFCTALELRMAFTCLNNWGKKSKEEYSWLWKLYEILISVSVNSSLGSQWPSHAHSCVCCLGQLLYLSWLVATETIWSIKPNMLSGPLQTKFADPLF